MLINGALWALVISVVAFLWYQDLQLSYIIAGAMMINLVTAALAGAYLPLILKRLDIDPALAGSVALTTSLTLSDSLHSWGSPKAFIFES